MSTIQNGLDQLYPDANRDLGINIEPLKQVIVGNVGGTLLLLSGAVGLVLLIACANVANLLLARSAVRTREFADSLGARCESRAHGAAVADGKRTSLARRRRGLGLLIAMLGVRSVLAAVAESLPRSENIGVNGPVLLFTLSVSIAVGILFGLAPALKNWNADLQASFKEGGRGLTSAHHRAQSSLVIVQMALTLVLLGGCRPVVPHDPPLMGSQSRLRHTARYHVQGGSFAFADEDGLEHSNRLSAVDRAYSEDSRRAGGGFYGHRSAERSGRYHALLDWLAEARFTSGGAAAGDVS